MNYNWFEKFILKISDYVEKHWRKIFLYMFIFVVIDLIFGKWKVWIWIKTPVVIVFSVVVGVLVVVGFLYGVKKRDKK